MSDLISRQVLIKEMRETEEMLQKGLGKDAKFAYVTCDSVVRTIEQQPTVDNMEKLFSKISGHSDYHGDNILVAIQCLREGKEIGNVPYIKSKPYNVGKVIERLEEKRNEIYDALKHYEETMYSNKEHLKKAKELREKSLLLYEVIKIVKAGGLDERSK